jgi:dihydroxy-acid dehydratase
VHLDPNPKIDSFRGKVIAYDDERVAYTAIQRGEVKAGHVLVVRHEGPVAGAPGMPEMLSSGGALVCRQVGTLEVCLSYAPHV